MLDNECCENSFGEMSNEGEKKSESDKRKKNNVGGNNKDSLEKWKNEEEMSMSED